jgi:hypothetical protein
MSGYREHSFDPYAYEQPGRPMHPFNRVQWCGAALIVTSITTLLLYFAGRAGWIVPLVEGVQVSTMLSIFGLALINSRREPGTRVGSEQLQRNRRVLLITVAAVAAILGIATIIEFSGA